jgi:predicted secreted protein
MFHFPLVISGYETDRTVVAYYNGVDMSVLTVIQYVCERTNVPKPATVLGNTDTQIVQMLRLLEEEGNDLSRRGDWEGITFEATHTSLAAESQGALTSIATNGFRYIKQGTLWDRTNKLPILGPLSDQDWQQMKAITTTGPRYRYRIRGGNLLINPTPTAGYSWAFEYISKNWMLGIDGTTYKQYATLDSDTILLPEDLVLMGLRWRWKKEKGLEYAEDQRTYEFQVKDALGRDGGKPTLRMDGEAQDAKPGIFVPTMSAVP